MYEPCIDMTIGNFGFDFVHQIEIESSWQMLTDTGKILLPNNISLNEKKRAELSKVMEVVSGYPMVLDRNNLRKLLKPGDPVTIAMGYDQTFSRFFDGYIVGIKPNTPVEINIEDWMYELKTGSIKETVKNAKLSTLVSKFFTKIDCVYDDMEIGTIVIDKLTPARLLDKLRETYGIYCFIRQGKLVLGKQYNPDTAVDHTFTFQQDIIDNNLEYRRKEDMKLMVTAISNSSSGKVLEIKKGETEGEERQLKYYNVSKEALKKYAEREYDRLKYDGFHGTFTTFGLDPVFHGDRVKLVHPLESDLSGQYWTDKVVYRNGTDGFRQIITLGPKI